MNLIFDIGGRGGDGWQYKEVMLKPWMDFVTHRLVVKKGGALTGVAGRAGAGEARSSGYVARWLKPELNVDDRFGISTSGIILM